MEYKIKLYHEQQYLNEITMDGEIILLEFIDFIVENYKQIFKESDKPRILVKSRNQNKHLDPKQSFYQLLGNMKGDSFDIEINQQSQIESQQKYVQQQIPINNQSIQQHIQVEQIQQNQNQSINQQYLKLTLKYRQQQISCELRSDNTLTEVKVFVQDQFNIQEQFYLICNQLDLSQMNQETKLNNLQLKDNMVIEAVSQKEDQSSNLVKIQFNIEDGMIQRSCVLICKIHERLGDVKIGVLSFVGITSFDIADVDFYFGKTLMSGKKLNETLHSLHITKDFTTIIAKVRWIGG